MKFPLRSTRVNLTHDGNNEERVTLDGLTKGYVLRCPPAEGGWYWRTTEPETGYGHARTRTDAVRAVLGFAPGHDRRTRR